MSPHPDHCNVFFSSCFTDAGDVYLSIRDRIRKNFNTGDSKPIWMGEDFEYIALTSAVPPIEKALFCVKGVALCDAYVAVVIDKHGSGVELPSLGKTQASFFELELFEAAVSHKPAFVFILKGNEPKGRMAAVLNLLKPALPGYCPEPLDEDEILRRIEKILIGTRHPWLARLQRFAALGSVAHDRLGLSRYQRYNPATELPSLRFFDDPYDPTFAAPSLDLVEILLASVDTYQDSQSRLAIIWLTLRELMGERPSRALGDRHLRCWDMAFSKWSSTAAWYGLHGFCLMGCLGAISSRARILLEYNTALPAPHGGFASEYYSIAKKAGNPQLRAMFFDLALSHINIALHDKESSGALAVRGSIFWQVGRHADSITDYRRVVDLREDSDAAPAAKGEAKAELGFALAHNRATRRQGLELLENGVELASQSEPNGFLIRAKRKLGIGYALAGAPRRALSELTEAYDLALDRGLYDQIGRLERVAKQIDRVLPFLKAPEK